MEKITGTYVDYGIHNYTTWHHGVVHTCAIAIQCLSISGVDKLGTLGHMPQQPEAVPYQLQVRLQIIDVKSAVVDRDWVLKIHKDLEFSSADSYLFPQKSRAVRSESVWCTRLSYYNKVSYAPLISLHASLQWLMKWLYTMHKSSVVGVLLIQGNNSLCGEHPVHFALKFPQM